jgi:hypothetical protein
MSEEERKAYGHLCEYLHWLRSANKLPEKTPLIYSARILFDGKNVTLDGESCAVSVTR